MYLTVVLFQIPHHKEREMKHNLDFGSKDIKDSKSKAKRKTWSVPLHLCATNLLAVTWAK